MSTRYPALVVSLLFCCILTASVLATSETADEEFIPTYNPSLEVSRAAGTIVTDGRLDDPGWRGAARVGNFAEHRPGDQTKPPVETEALITYDDDYLYVAFVCYDDPSTIRASYCDRDRVFADDNIVLLLDTYADAAWAYELNVNPYGIQGDVLWSPNTGEDIGFDLVWESAGMVTDSGYQTEMSIPFSSIRFPNRSEQVWKMDFWRNHPRDSRGQYSWAAMDRDNPCWPCQWGTVTGIQDVQPGRGIELLPSIVGFQTSVLEGDGTVDSPFDFRNDDPDGDVSLGAKYAISSGMTTEVTYNPDFSQVETDATQIDVNTTFALFYPEKRPFFQEGSDLFSTIYDVVYTRSINDPLFAAKATGRFNRTSIAYMAARDENSPVILPFEEESIYLQTGKSTSNILRARQTFGNDSQIGFLATDRRLDGGGSGTNLSLDGSFRLSKPFTLNWQAIGSYTQEPDDTLLTYDSDDTLFNSSRFDDAGHTAGFDGESFSGHALIALLDYSSRHVYSSLRYSEMSPTFRADNGFEPSNNKRQASLMTYYTFYPESNIFEFIEPSIFTGLIWNFTGTEKKRWAEYNLSGRLKIAQTNFHLHYQRVSEELRGVQFDNTWKGHSCFNSTPSDLLAFGAGVNYGNQIARHELKLGKETYLSGWIDIKPVDRMLIENWLNYTQSYDIDTDDELYKGYIARTRVNYQILRKLTLRLVVEYSDFSKGWNIDPLLTYRLNPFSIFYVGTTYDYDYYEGLGADEKGTSTRLASRQFFMKLQYLFQI